MASFSHISPGLGQLSHAKPGLGLLRRVRQHRAVMALCPGDIPPLRGPARQHQGHLVIGLQRLQQALGARLIPLLVQLPGVGQQLATGEAAIQFLHVSRPTRSRHFGQHGAGLG
ncbi:hypothetical protein D3C71_606260 [compost metagenome]